MWPFTRRERAPRAIPLVLANTLSGKKELFIPLKPGSVTLYSCGPTVYSQAHIGNLRAYVFSDTLARTLMQSGLRVRRVINITDVGHLTGDNTGDADSGEDRMERSAREAGVRAGDIADRYTALFMKDIQSLNIDTASVLFPHATQYMPEQLALAQALETKGYTYLTSDGLYFDTSSFASYGKLGGVLAANADHGRIAQNPEKRHSADFALWKFSQKDLKRQQEWQSPWGRGFPGWHLECSAMSKALLGAEIDIHTGGVDHIPVHHNNEIAQSESASGKPLARYWMHSAFLTIDEARIGKSLGNAILMSDIETKGLHPLALRYLFLQAHYRSPLSFSWEALTAADEALMRLWRRAQEVREAAAGTPIQSTLVDQFIAYVRDDLATPKALAYLWEVLKHDDEYSPEQVWGLLTEAEKVLGLCLATPPQTAPLEIPEGVAQLVSEREHARTQKDFARADALRIHIENRGYHVDDEASGPVVTQRSH